MGSTKRILSSVGHTRRHPPPLKSQPGTETKPLVKIGCAVSTGKIAWQHSEKRILNGFHNGADSPRKFAHGCTNNGLSGCTMAVSRFLYMIEREISSPFITGRKTARGSTSHKA